MFDTPKEVVEMAKYYFDKYITNVYIKRKMDLYIQENGNEIFVYYKSKLDKITE